MVTQPTPLLIKLPKKKTGLIIYPTHPNILSFGLFGNVSPTKAERTSVSKINLKAEDG